MTVRKPRRTIRLYDRKCIVARVRLVLEAGEYPMGESATVECPDPDLAAQLNAAIFQNSERIVAIGGAVVPNDITPYPECVYGAVAAVARKRGLRFDAPKLPVLVDPRKIY